MPGSWNYNYSVSQHKVANYSNICDDLRHTPCLRARCRHSTTINISPLRLESGRRRNGRDPRPFSSLPPTKPELAKHPYLALLPKTGGDMLVIIFADPRVCDPRVCLPFGLRSFQSSSGTVVINTLCLLALPIPQKHTKNQTYANGKIRVFRIMQSEIAAYYIVPEDLVAPISLRPASHSQPSILRLGGVAIFVYGKVWSSVVNQFTVDLSNMLYNSKTQRTRLCELGGVRRSVSSPDIRSNHKSDVSLPDLQSIH